VIRKTLLPRTPRNIVHLDIDNLEINTFFKENYLVINDRENNLLIFSCYEN